MEHITPDFFATAPTSTNAGVAALVERFADAKKKERHRTHDETMYWFHVYKNLARDATEALVEKEQP